MLVGLNVLALSHWARSVRVQNAIVCVEGGDWWISVSWEVDSFLMFTDASSQNHLGPYQIVIAISLFPAGIGVDTIGRARTFQCLYVDISILMFVILYK